VAATGTMDGGGAGDLLLHFSEDPSIERFEPHVARGREGDEPLVWAIDRAHAPLYWFPRDCPGVATWARTPREAEQLRARYSAAGDRLHAIEAAWLDRMAAATVYAYAFAPDGFEPWPAADGHHVRRTACEPVSVEPVGDLLQLHARAGVELRVLDDLWPMHDLVAGGPLPFSIVRMRDATPRWTADPG
jgi:hypothetical protein